MKLLSPSSWTDYELIDSGGFEKLERYGKYILARPEPQAVWEKSLSEEEWEQSNHAYFRKFKDGKHDPTENSERGEWILKKGMPQQWSVNYSYKQLNLKFRLGLTAFKHIGLFPEQAENWNYIYDTLQQLKVEKPKVLNLFAYTGGASLAACYAGAEVTHVDSVKQVITWSKENMDACGLKDIHWVVEDALKFVGREVKRGKKYQGIILDPPAYGRGPDNEKWLLEKNINELMKQCSKLLADKSGFLVLNLYSMGFSPLIAENLVKNHFSVPSEMEMGELFFPDRSGKRLPLGIFLRFRNL